MRRNTNAQRQRRSTSAAIVESGETWRCNEDNPDIRRNYWQKRERFIGSGDAVDRSNEAAIGRDRHARPGDAALNVLEGHDRQRPRHCGSREMMKRPSSSFPPVPGFAFASSLLVVHSRALSLTPLSLARSSTIDSSLFSPYSHHSTTQDRYNDVRFTIRNGHSRDRRASSRRITLDKP